MRDGSQDPEDPLRRRRTRTGRKTPRRRRLGWKRLGKAPPAPPGRGREGRGDPDRWWRCPPSGGRGDPASDQDDPRPGGLHWAVTRGGRWRCGGMGGRPRPQPSRPAADGNVPRRVRRPFRAARGAAGGGGAASAVGRLPGLARPRVRRERVPGSRGEMPLRPARARVCDLAGLRETAGFHGGRGCPRWPPGPATRGEVPSAAGLGRRAGWARSSGRPGPPVSRRADHDRPHDRPGCLSAGTADAQGAPGRGPTTAARATPRRRRGPAAPARPPTGGEGRR